MSESVSAAPSSVLPKVAGVLGILSGLVLVVGELALISGGAFDVSRVTIFLEAIAALVGGFLCLRGLIRIGPWILIAAFLLGEMIGRFVAGALFFDGLRQQLPWWGFSYSNRQYDYGTTNALAILAIDLAFWILLAATILAVVALIKSASSSTLQTTGGLTVSNSQGNVPAGWYADPDGKPVQRYWDGSAWTDQNRPAVGQPMASMPAARIGGAPQNGMGTAALTLGILGFFCFPLIASVLAIIFGKIGMTRADQGQATNRGAAKAGFILGIIGLVLGGIGLIIWGAALASTPSYY